MELPRGLLLSFSQNRGASLVSSQGPCWKKYVARHFLPSGDNNASRRSLAPRAAKVHYAIRPAWDSGTEWWGVGKILWRRHRLPTPVFLGFPCGSTGKEPTCNAGDLGSIPGLGRLKKGTAILSSTLAWRIP